MEESSAYSTENNVQIKKEPKEVTQAKSAPVPQIPMVDNASDPEAKIQLFMSLFKGRNDVYARRWENLNKGTKGYSPVCMNEWKSGLCNKPAIPCSKCKHTAYAALDKKTLERHLRGNFVAGIYAMLPDET